MPPKYLYKILSILNWRKSIESTIVHLSQDDVEFIHLATEEQLDRILMKFWGDLDEFVILKVESEKLIGRLVHEKNLGGINKYYHLYEGEIPLEAICEVKESHCSE